MCISEFIQSYICMTLVIYSIYSKLRPIKPYIEYSAKCNTCTVHVCLKYMTFCGYRWYFRMYFIVITGVKMRHSVRDLPVVSAEPVDLQKHSLVQGKAVYFLVKVHGRSCDLHWISNLNQVLIWLLYFHNNFVSDWKSYLPFTVYK